MSYKNMFGGAAPQAIAPVAPVSRASMFGNVSNDKEESLADITNWLRADPAVQVAPGRILFNLNGMKVEKITLNEIGTVGDYTIAESTEASKCLEQVVTEFAEMKPYLDGPKTALREALDLIEADTKPKGLKGFFTRKTAPALTPAELRTKVKERADNALDLMKNCVKYRIEPFIEGLGDAIHHCDDISKALEEAIATVNYVNQRATDASVKDLALRRAAMFGKSAMLMDLNKGQLNQMLAFCHKNKAFLEELDTSIIPVLGNIMRAAVIGDASGDSMEDIAVKMKGLLQ